MVTVGSTGLWGLLMNVLSTCAFVCTAAYFYQRNKTIKNAVIGLVVGVLLMTAVMLLWNWLITPIYMGQPREFVATLLIPYFLPFNLIKGGINATLTILLYKPVVTALRKAKLVKPSSGSSRARMEREILPSPTLMTLTLTSWPSFRTSAGVLTLFLEIWETCRSPVAPPPRLMNAP